MSKLKSSLKSILRPGLLLVAKTRLKNLGNTASHGGPLFADVVRNSIAKKRSSTEQNGIQTIEDIRAELAASTESINMIDYGVDVRDPKADQKEGKIYPRFLAEITHDSKEPFWALLLYHLIRKFEPDTVLEMGTSLGFSAAYMAMALQQNDNGRLITLEGDPTISEQAKSNFKKAHLTNTEVITGKFKDTLPAVLSDHAPFDVVFIDGHHDGPATVAYFEQILPHLTDEAICIFDDIRWSDSMQQAMKEISSHQAVNFTLDLRGMALCYINRQESGQQTVYLPLI